MTGPVTVLAVDDQPANLRLLDAVLTPRGHRVLTASSGTEGLALLETEDVDLVLLDIVMPGMDGHEVCRRIRSTPATEFLPVVMITASGTEQRLAALESGADDFVTKPFDKSELLARVASLARIKRYHDTIRRQTDELTKWNTELETRVATQVAELERTNRLRRFLSPQLADLVVGDETLLGSHRREIVVVFTDLRNFTPFAENSEPEEVMGVLAEYHRAIGRWSTHTKATLERFTGDGIMVFFNDPIPCDDAAERAVRMALEHPGRRQRAFRTMVPARSRPRPGNRYRPGLCDPRQDRLREPLRLCRHRQRHESRRPAVFRRRPLAGIGHRPRARSHRARVRLRDGRRRATKGIQPHGAGPQHQRAR